MAAYPEPPLPQVEGYRLTEQLYRARRTAVYRGISETQQQKVVVKLLYSDSPSFSELVKFRNQYVVASNLSINGVVKPLALKRWRNSYALVMEDFGGIALGEYVRRQRMDWPDVLAIALQIADILHGLHQAHVIHKDLKPANLLIHAETKQIQLIDFSLASLLPKETQALQSPHALEGTLAYMAPEQTGRMNRGIDYRADFYALGVTLYELLTGQLPFSSDDPLALLYCHIATTPVAVHDVNAQVPPALSAIVAKLMAKDVEARYQSALGLKHDLQICWNQWHESGRAQSLPIEPFELGQRDVGDRFLIPETLYGRAAEVQTLLDAFERIAQGTSELLLVAGQAGIGKTAVINEVHRPITQKNGYFIKGKFDQFNRDIPFFAFVQAFRCLMGQLLGESDAALASWKAQILAAVGENGQVLIEVIPELEQIIGKQPAVPELSGSEAQNRFHLIFGQFIRVFTTPAHPLVIFLDDLQWADAASLNLFKLLMDDDSGYLLVLGAYRNNEVCSAHPLMLALAEVQNLGCVLSTLTLEALSENEIEYLVADTLQSGIEHAKPLAQLIRQKNQGNPFFSIQSLQDLYSESLIFFDRETSCWQYDLTQIYQSLLSDDLSELMMGRLHQLPAATQEALKLSACIGHQFDLQTLALVCECSQEDAAANLWPSLQMGLVVPASHHYKFFQDGPGKIESTDAMIDGRKIAYRFLHDCVQKLAYALIPEDQKNQVHWHLGQLLIREISEDSHENRIFELVTHLNHGVDYISDQNFRDNVAQLNLRACQKAKRTTAHQSGEEYARLGIAWLGSGAWERQYDLTLQLHNLAAELSWLCSDLEAMDSHIEVILQQSQSLLDQIPAFCLRMQANTSQMQFAESLMTAQHVFELLGIPLPGDLNAEDLQVRVSEIEQLLSNRSISELVNLPTMDQQTDIAVIQIISQVIPAAYICGSPLFPVVVILGVKLLIQAGNSPLSAYIYANYAYVLCNYCHLIERSEEFGYLALTLANKPEAKLVRPQVYVMLALYMQHRKSPLRETLILAQQGHNSAQDVGNHQWAGYAAYAFCANGFASAQNLIDLGKTVEDYCHRLVKLNQIAPSNWCQVYRQAILSLTNPTSCKQHIFFETLDQESDFLAGIHKAEDLLGLYHFHLCQLITSYLLGDIEAAHQHTLEARDRLDVAQGTVGLPVFHFYESLILMDQLTKADLRSDEGKRLIQKIEINQDILQQDWAYHAPSNYQHKFKLVQAEKLGILGQRWAALDLYEEAIADANKHGYPQEEALANELAARFYLKWNKDKVAAGYMQEAYYGYRRWGAKAKTNALEQDYPHLLRPILEASGSNDSLETLADVAGFSLSSYSSAASASLSRNTKLDFAAILQAAQLLSEKISLEELLNQLAQLMLQNSGADKLAVLLPDRENNWQVRAIATSETTELLSESLADSLDLPIQLLQYAKNTAEVIAIDNLEIDLPIVDPYLQQYQPRSLLCIPMQHQKSLRGMLYFQNESISGVFHRDRIIVLNFLCAQAAITLENSRLYELEQSRTEALAASEKRLKTLFDQAADAVFLMRDVDQGFIDCNQAAVDLFGYENKAQIIGLQPHQLSPERQPDGQRSVDAAQAMIEQALRQGSVQFEWLHQRFDGEQFWTEVMLTSIGYQEETLFHCTVRDISDRKAAEQKLLESQTFLQIVLDTFPLAVFWKDLDCRYISANQHFIKDAGFEDAEEIAGLTDFEMPWSEAEAQSFRADDQEVMLSDTPKLGILQTQINADGKQAWLETNKLPLHDLNDNVIGVLSIYQDVSARKHSEQQLQELSERLELAVESAGLGIWEWTRTNDFLSWDERMFEIYGIQPEDFGGTYQDWANLVHPEDLDQTEAEKRHSDENQTTRYQQEFRIVRPDGQIRYILATASIQRDAQGQPLRSVGTNLDITARKAAELALQDAQAQFQRLTENVPGMLYRYVLHSDGRDEFTYVSSQVRELFELEPEAILQDIDLIWERFPLDDIAKFRHSLQKSALTLQPHYDECRLLLPSKGFRWVQVICRPERLSNGDVAWDGVVVDISDRKRAELSWEQEVLRRTSIFNASSDGIHIIDIEGNLIEANTSFQQILGYTSEEIIHLNVADWDAQWSREEIKAIIQNYAQNNSAEIRTFETMHRRKDGSIFPVEISVCSMEWHSQFSLVCIARDISERKQAEIQLQRTNEELMQATRMKDEFLANMSHELRTPLNTVIGFSQLMQRDSSLSDKHRETLNTINRSGEHLLSLINDILEMSKIEAGQTAVNLEAVDLPQLLDDLKDMLAIKADAKQLRFIFNYADSLPRYIQVDEVKLRQILLNLLSNALKFTEQGEVAFNAEVIEPQRDERDGKTHLRFSVKDTGPGISAQSQHEIFQPFIQASAGRYSRQGTGLGLSISKKFAEMIGGNISVRSVEGQGSTFYCDLYVEPLSADTIPETTPCKHYENIQGLKEPQTRYRLLVVDDNPDNRSLLLKMLSIPGFELEIASHGLEAVQWNERWRPHLIWMDIRMPVMDGLEAMRQIRQSDHQPIIIAITANVFVEERERALAAGSDDFVSKPFSANEIFERLERWLNLEFILEEGQEVAPNEVSGLGDRDPINPALILEQLRTMPASWQIDIQQAVFSLNSEQVIALLEQLPETQSSLQGLLLSLLEAYRYDVLVDIFKLLR